MPLGQIDGAASSSASFLFGRQAPVDDWDPAAHAKAHQYITDTSLDKPVNLDDALQKSARSSLDTGRRSVLNDTTQLTFAPNMSAPPGGASYVLPTSC